MPEQEYEVEVVDHFCNGDQDCVHFWVQGKLYVYYFLKGTKLETALRSFIKALLKK